MKKILYTYILIVLLYIFILFNLNNSVITFSNNDSVILGGQCVGIKLLATGVLVVEIDRKDIDLQIGDVILKVNDSKIESNNELINYCKLNNGEKLNLEISRNNEIIQTSISPILDNLSNEYRLRVMG
jgi:stage IV sporulation protein B